LSSKKGVKRKIGEKRAIIGEKKKLPPYEKGGVAKPHKRRDACFRGKKGGGEERGRGKATPSAQKERGKGLGGNFIWVNLGNAYDPVS